MTAHASRPEDDDHALAKLTDAVDSVRLRDGTVASLMSSSVITCLPRDTLERAAGLMWDHACGCVPIVDQYGKPVAMLTDRDICMAAYTQGKPLFEMTVESAMSSRLLTAMVHEPLADVERRMRCHSVRRLPVLNEEGRIVGLISIDDIARAAFLDQAPSRDPLSTSAFALTAAGLQYRAR